MLNWIVFIVSLVSFFSTHLIAGETIYGEDDRSEIELSLLNEIQGNSDSVAVLTLNKRLFTSSKKGYTQLAARPLKDNGYIKFCEEKSIQFIEQNVLGFCTAFLVSKKHMLTSGHCFKKVNKEKSSVKIFNQCENVSAIFGYKTKNGAPQLVVPTRNIYSCKKIEILKKDRLFDYALIELDREVKEREIPEFSELNIDAGESVYALGHPLGLPLKLMDNASVKKNYLGINSFLSNLDSFEVNSGSPVFSEMSHKVVGMLTHGDRDFIKDSMRNCYRIKKCEDDSEDCKFETATHIQAILSDIKLHGIQLSK